MCRINCSGGCPECADDEHEEECVKLWTGGCNRCICDLIKKIRNEERCCNYQCCNSIGGCGCEG